MEGWGCLLEKKGGLLLSQKIVITWQIGGNSYNLSYLKYGEKVFKKLQNMKKSIHEKRETYRK